MHTPIPIPKVGVETHMTPAGPARPARPGRPFGRRLGEGGFTYLAALFAIVVMGLALSATGQVWSTVAQREKEKELLFRGAQIRAAIAMYFEGSPGIKRYPRELEALVKDPRQPTVRRYLRKVYSDPMTREGDWELIKEKDGSIVGVRSASTDEPFKKSGFPEELAEFEGSSSYRDWEFAYRPEKKSKGK